MVDPGKSRILHLNGSYSFKWLKFKRAEKKKKGRTPEGEKGKEAPS